MSSQVDITKEKVALSGAWGAGRAVIVNTLIHPLGVVKIRLLCSKNESNTIRVALDLFRQEGIGAFYKGLTPQLIKACIKPIFVWPMVTGMPSILQRYQVQNLQQQALTGLAISTVDAAILTPLERAKILCASKGIKFRLKDLYKEGWKGLTTNWSQLSVNWMTFLTAQKYLRDQSYSSSGQPLSLSELIKIGTQTALIVSVASAPFDVANTLKQAQDLSPSHLLSRSGIFQLYRGWPLNALSLVIQSVASVIIIEKLSR